MKGEGREARGDEQTKDVLMAPAGSLHAAPRHPESRVA